MVQRRQDFGVAHVAQGEQLAHLDERAVAAAFADRDMEDQAFDDLPGALGPVHIAAVAAADHERVADRGGEIDRLVRGGVDHAERVEGDAHLRRHVGDAMRIDDNDAVIRP